MVTDRKGTFFGIQGRRRRPQTTGPGGASRIAAVAEVQSVGRGGARGWRRALGENGRQGSEARHRDEPVRVQALRGGIAS